MNEIDRGNDRSNGAPLGVALLLALREMPEVETHLVMSKWAKQPLSWKRLTACRTLLRWLTLFTARLRPPLSPPARFAPTA